MKIKSALISVFDKTGIDKLAKELVKNGVLLYSTGGTKKYLEGLGLSVLAVEDQTNYPEVFGGRVKTLHPAIFGGILYRRDNESDNKELKEHQIPEIDLVVVDLYPFEETVASGADHSSIIEKIDIGGISLIRAAAKNYKFTSIISTKKQYDDFTNHYLNTNGSPTIEYRKKLAAEAFGITMNYDKAISGYFQNKQRVTLRYGENPHQEAYFDGDIEGLFKKLNGKELSYNNLLDIDAAVSLITDVSDNESSTFAILKHNNACGCATRKTVFDAFKDALASDPVSAFGGILITDRQIDLETAEKIDELFYEVCIAPSFTKEALEVLTQKSKRIILEWSKMEYKQDIVSRANLFDPDTIFFIFSIVLILSPGTILSGLYPVENSSLKVRPDFSSKIGVHTSSVTPGYTVDSYITIEPFFIILPTNLLDSISGLRSGVLFSLIGVGTVIINMLFPLISLIFDVNFEFLTKVSKFVSEISSLISILLTS